MAKKTRRSRKRRGTSGMHCTRRVKKTIRGHKRRVCVKFSK